MMRNILLSSALVPSLIGAVHAQNIPRGLNFENNPIYKKLAKTSEACEKARMPAGLDHYVAGGLLNKSPEYFAWRRSDLAISHCYDAFDQFLADHGFPKHATDGQ